ncbi:protein of unknown function [Taphrina deformans PYCC 5710]|uniref:Phosphatidate cytidylyltransferase, mitochondrial n=1 Tax=Taphrina deformans (strain PYCC 5710 / ATCC 11124 / CBS 356.35 / IMI 108563 / JCM 9778 / NBRC 8474) TaxID=1097556 RepID=R4XIF8_TAPDE|nr:protein of unknown function [Taphrina deformans PYCC 5710]|eukprot:CCG84289.1 protein of unknown function [Taphrina deformans PYCC 5710]
MFFVWRQGKGRPAADLFRSFSSTRLRPSDRQASTRHQENDVLSADQEAGVEEFSDLPKSFGVNQHIDIDSDLHDRLRSVLWKFKAPIRYAFAYGSGVFSQKGYDGSTKPMVDYIFGVSYAQHFHSLNLHHHPDHYSFLRRLGSGVVGHVQTGYGAGVYFNPYVEVDGVMIKYGVVLLDDLCADLTDWRTLYLAGRMQKPVKILRDNAQVRMANQRNLYSAVRTALLLLPDRFDERQLYTTIAGLSYMGDPRMAFGEHPHKVDNIVARQLLHFRHLYTPFIERLPNVAFTSRASIDDPDRPGSLVQDLDPIKRGNMVRRLPAAFRAKLYHRYRRILGPTASLSHDADDADDASPYGGAFDRQIAASEVLAAELGKSVRATVSWPSTSQSIKGVLTAGPVKSWRYVAEKLKKARTKSVK